MLELPLDVTYDQKYRVACSLKVQSLADEYFDAMVRHTMARFQGMNREQAEEVNRKNLSKAIDGTVDGTRRNALRSLYNIPPLDF